MDGAKVKGARTGSDPFRVTGRVRLQGSGEERAFTLTVESADPHVAQRPRTLTMDVEGMSRVRGVVR